MGSRIFVLDDDQQVVDLIVLILKRDGHQVEGATSYEKALESLSRRPADLLVSDLSMPGVGGIAGIRSLTRKGFVQRALVVSGYIDSDVMEFMSQMPEIVGYLEKPFDIHELARLVRLHLKSPQEGQIAREG